MNARCSFYQDWRCPIWVPTSPFGILNVPQSRAHLTGAALMEAELIYIIYTTTSWEMGTWIVFGVLRVF